MALVSVLIVVKNEEKSLPLLFRLLDKQTYKNLEIIVVDNGSTDNTPKIIEEYSCRSPYKVKKDMVLGTLAQAYNRALDLAEGNYIVIIGGDQIPSKTWIEEHVKCLQKGCDACLAPVIYFSKKTTSVARWYFNRSILEILFNKAGTPDRIVFNTGNVSFKAYTIKKVRFYDPMPVSVDGEMSYRFIKHGFKLCFCETSLSFHHAPVKIKHHISLWWKLAYANKATFNVHPYLDLKKLFFRHILLAHLDPREWIKTSLYKGRLIMHSIFMHITAFLTLLITYSYLSLLRENVLWKYVQRIKE